MTDLFMHRAHSTRQQHLRKKLVRNNPAGYRKRSTLTSSATDDASEHCAENLNLTTDAQYLIDTVHHHTISPSHPSLVVLNIKSPNIIIIIRHQLLQPLHGNQQKNI
jgi:hypothetical protein